MGNIPKIQIEKDEELPATDYTFSGIGENSQINAWKKQSMKLTVMESENGNGKLRLDTANFGWLGSQILPSHSILL